MTARVPARSRLASPPASPAVVVVESDAERRARLANALGPGTVAFASVDEATSELGCGVVEGAPAAGAVVVVSGPSLPPVAALPLAAVGAGRVVVAVHGRASTSDLRAAMVAGVSDLVSADAPVAQLRHAVRRAGVAAEMGARGGVGVPEDGAAVSGAPGSSAHPLAETDPAPSGGGVVAVVAPKGGSGATTVAVNLAAALASGAPGCGGDPPVAVVVDADLQFGDAALVCGVEPERSLASLVRAAPGGPHPPPDATSVGRTLVGVSDTAVALLAAPVDPTLAEVLPAGLLGEVLDVLAGLVAWVVVDLPAHVDDRAMEVLDRAATILVVASPDPLAAKDARAAVDLLDRLGLGARWSVVCNAPSAAPGVGVGALEQHLGRRVLASIPHDPAVPAAVVRGLPVVVDVPAAPSSRAFAALADALRTPVPGGVTPGSSLRQVVDRLVGGGWRGRGPGG